MSNPSFQRSSPKFEEAVSNWEGIINFQNVFVTKFPEPHNASLFSQGFWNNNAIFLAQAKYGGNMIASICCSTVPENRSPEEDMSNLVNSLLGTAKQYGTTSSGYELMRVMEGTSPFGDTIIYEITNIAPEGKNGPLPLNIGASYPIEDGLKSMCVNSIFQRPQAKSRVELSVFYELPPNFVAQKGQNVAQDLSNMLMSMNKEFLFNTYDLTKHYLQA